MEGNNKSRSSNFELLRIAAMFMIVLFHIQLHGAVPMLSSPGDYFNEAKIYKRLLIFDVGTPLGMIGNGLFTMISGYFMSQNPNINVAKVAKKILLQMGFALIILLLASGVYVGVGSDYVFSPVTLKYFNEEWWFVGYYFLIILFAKVFLNNFIAKLNRENYRMLVLSLFAVTEFSYCIGQIENIGVSRNLLAGVFLYALSGYIAKYNPFKKVRSYALVLVIIITTGVRIFSNYLTNLSDIDAFIKNGGQGTYIHNAGGYSMNEITVIILTVAIFELFRRINIPNNKVINYLGGATLMIYFCHENPFFWAMYRNEEWLQLLGTNFIGYVFNWLGWAAIGMLPGIVAYTLFNVAMKLFAKFRWLVIKDETQPNTPK